MLLVLFTTLFWTGLAFALHRNRKVFLATSVSVGIFLISRFDFLTGQTILGHIDTLGNLNQLYAFDSLMRDFSFSEYLAAWNPFNNGGQPLLPKFNLHFYLLWGLNDIDPWGFKLPIVHNYLALNYIVVVAVGMLLLCHALIEDWKSAFLAFFLTLFSTLALVAYMEEIPRWLFMKPYVFLCVVEWAKRKNPWFLAAGLGFFGVLAAQYLVNGTVLTFFGLGLFFLWRDFAKVKKLVWNRAFAGAVLVGGLLFAGAATPTVNMARKTRDYVDGGRNFNVFYDASAETPVKAAIRTHNARVSDLYSAVLNNPLSAEYHAWFYCGPFLVFLAAIGIVADLGSPVVVAIALTTFGVTLSALFPGVFFGAIPVLNLLRNGIFLLNDVMFGLVILAAFGFRSVSQFATRKRFSTRVLLFLVCFGTFLSFIYTHWKEIDRRAKEVAGGRIRATLESEPPIRYPAFRYPQTRPCLGRNFRKYDWEEGTACVTADNSRAHSGMMPTRYARLLSVSYPTYFFSRDDYGLSDRDARYAVFANNDAPIFFFTNRAKFPQGDLRENLRQMFRDYETDKIRAAHFYPGDAAPSAVSKSLPPTTFPVALSYGGPSRVELHLAAPTDGYLVRAENFDEDWKVTVNGKTTPIFHGNYAFQTVPIPAGKSHVVFSYRPSYPWWFWLHQIAFFTSGAMWVISSSKLRLASSSNTHRRT